MPPTEDQPAALPDTVQTEAPAVLTVGVFDGVHLGHRALIERASAIAERHSGGVRVVALAFDPAPAAALAPGSEPPRLTTFEDRADLLLDAGADEVLRLTPTRELLGLSPEAFVDDVLVPLRPLAVVEGPDFCFGARRAGDVGTLAELGRARGFGVDVVEPIEVDLDDQTVVPARARDPRRRRGRAPAATARVCSARAPRSDHRDRPRSARPHQRQSP
ncbi:MAG: adenylyltransferase/cytidyltransferase family protein, partial [Planctomycetota bacterium]